MLSCREPREQEQEFARPNKNTAFTKSSVLNCSTNAVKRVPASPLSGEKKLTGSHDDRQLLHEELKNSSLVLKKKIPQDRGSAGVFRVLNFANMSVDESAACFEKNSEKNSSRKKDTSSGAKENNLTAKTKGKCVPNKEASAVKNKAASSKQQEMEKKSQICSIELKKPAGQAKAKDDLTNPGKPENGKRRQGENANMTSISLKQMPGSSLNNSSLVESAAKHSAGSKANENRGQTNKMTKGSTKKLTIDLGKAISKKITNPNKLLVSSVTNVSDSSFSLLKAESSKNEMSYLEKIFQSPAGENNNLNSSQNSLNTKSFFQEIKDCKDKGVPPLLKNKVKEKALIESKQKEAGEGAKSSRPLTEFHTPKSKISCLVNTRLKETFKERDPSTINLDLSQDLSSVKRRDIQVKEELPSSSYQSVHKPGAQKGADSSAKAVTSSHELTKEQLREKLIKKTILSFQIKKRPPTTTLDFYKIHKILGKGAFGSVYLGEEILTEKFVAIKAIEKTFLKNEMAKKRLMQEVMIMKKMNHKNVIKLLEVFESKRFIFIVMEYSKGKNLHKLIKEKGLYSEQKTKTMVSQLISGLSYVHEQSILHRDIKLDNLLLNEESMELKICDFGISRPVIKNKKMTEQSGTPAYMAPELIKGKGYEGYGSDLWALGVVVFTLLNGSLPFKGNTPDELINAIMKNDPKFEESVSKDGVDFVRRLLMNNPKKRASLPYLQKHKWLQGVETGEAAKQEAQAPASNANKKTGYLQMYGEKREEKQPLKENLVKQLEKFGFPTDYLEKCLSEDLYTHANACYQLLLCEE